MATRADLLDRRRRRQGGGDRGQGRTRSTASGSARSALTIVEKTEPAASWLGPQRDDLGRGAAGGDADQGRRLPLPQLRRQFGEHGEAVDAALMALLLAALRDRQRGATRAGSTPARPRSATATTASYLDLGAVAGDRGGDARARPRRRRSRSTRTASAGWSRSRSAEAALAPQRRGALLLTGPGIHRAFPHEPGVAAAGLPLRQQAQRVRPPARGPRAATSRRRRRRERAQLRDVPARLPAAGAVHVYTPMLPLSRGESFLENRVFSDPDEVDWAALDLQTRRDFVKHSDRGVFDPPSLAAIADDDRCRFVTGRVTDVDAARGGEGVRLEHESPEGLRRREHDYVVNCTGFDLLAQLRDALPGAECGPEIERAGGAALGHARPGTEVPIGRALELRRDGAAPAHPGPGGPQPGPRLRQPRRPRPALQPGAAAAAGRAPERALAVSDVRSNG